MIGEIACSNSASCSVREMPVIVTDGRNARPHQRSPVSAHYRDLGNEKIHIRAHFIVLSLKVRVFKIYLSSLAEKAVGEKMF